jgi:AcrR family transcriptional regulator
MGGSVTNGQSALCYDAPVMISTVPRHPLLSARVALQNAKARDRVLFAAYDLFSRHGIRAVGIDAIIEQSGVARMTLYRHFTSKEQLVLAFLEQREMWWTNGWLQQEVTSRAVTPRDQLLAVFDVFGEWFRLDGFEGCTFINVMLETPQGDDAIRRAAVEYLARIRKFLARLASEAGIRDADAFARKWHVLMKGSIVSAAEGDRDAGARAKAMATLVIDDALASEPR